MYICIYTYIFNMFGVCILRMHARLYVYVYVYVCVYILYAIDMHIEFSVPDTSLVSEVLSATPDMRWMCLPSLMLDRTRHWGYTLLGIDGDCNPL